MTEESNTLVKLAKAVIEHAPEGTDAFWDIKFSDIEAALSAAEPVAARYDFDGCGFQYIDNGSGSDWKTRHPDAEMLYSAPPAPSVAVKALDWHKQAMSHGYGLFIRLARTSIGDYQISHGAAGKYEVYFNKGPISAAYDSEPEAKAAAQADYEARIRSALSAQVKDMAGWQLVPKEPTEEMLDAYRVAETKKRFDIMSPYPTEEPEAGGGTIGYGYRAMLAAAPAKQEDG